MNETWDIGVDLDGCVYDFVQALREEIAFHYPHLDPSSEAQSWTFYEAWGLSHDDFLDVYSQSVVRGGVLWCGEPYPGVVSAWTSLRQAGHRIHIITDRRPPGAEDEARRATIQWLSSHGLEYDSLTFSPDKTLIRHHVRRKNQIAFIDDRSENFLALVAAGVPSFLMDRPWNQGTPGPRVTSLEHFAAKIHELAGKEKNILG